MNQLIPGKLDESIATDVIEAYIRLVYAKTIIDS